LPNPGKGQKLSCHDKVVNGNGKKPWKHARWTAGLRCCLGGRNLSR